MSAVYTWLASIEPWSLQYCAAIELPAKTLCPHVNTSHLDVAGEEGVAIAKKTRWRSTERGKGKCQTLTFLITVLPRAGPKYSL